jgi:protein-tyrosine phosphatase
MRIKPRKKSFSTDRTSSLAHAGCLCQSVSRRSALVAIPVFQAKILIEMQIAFICTANVCRSVMAQAILERIVKSRGLAMGVTSAGVFDFHSTPPADNAWLTCVQNGTPVSKMESSFVGGLDLGKIDVFLTMEEGHREVLLSDYKIPGEKVLLLGAFDKLSKDPEIADPMGKSKTAFEECFRRIERCVEGFLEVRHLQSNST